MSESRVGVVVLSCDKYERLWTPFFHFFRKEWSDCPWDTTLVTETAQPPLGHGYGVVAAGAGLSWGQQVATAMTRVNSEVVLLLLEDYFLTAPPTMSTLQRCVEQFAAPAVGYCRAAPTPPGNVPWRDEFTVHTVGTPYRTSLQPAFWRKTYLQRLAQRVATPWDFELCQSGDADVIHLSVNRETRPFSYINAMRLGVLQPVALEMCSAAGVALTGS